MALAPIVLFVYNRPAHTRKTLEALRANVLAEETLLYVFADGARADETPEGISNIDEVEKIVKSERWCKEVFFNKSNTNKGLAASIISGVTEIVNRHGHVVVLEDDIITSPFFLQYVNDGLKEYEDVKNVYAVNGYMFPIQTDTLSAFLCPLATSTWGWGTWADRWKAFQETPEHKDLIQSNEFLRRRFNFADYDYARMLDNRNSWGIRWYYSAFMRNGLGLFPTKTLCQNIGFGVDATHTKSEIDQMNLCMERVIVTKQEEINIGLYAQLLNHFAAREKLGSGQPSLSDKVVRYLWQLKQIIKLS